MSAPTLVHESLSLSARRFPDKAAVISGDQRVTYEVLNRSADLLAHSLANAGVRRHDRVVVFLDNSPESVISLYGILKAGGTFVILNGTMKAKKLAYILKDSGARCLISHVDKARVIEEAAGGPGDFGKIFWVGDSSRIPKGLVSCSVSWGDIAAGGKAEPVSRSREEGNVIGTIDQDLAALI